MDGGRDDEQDMGGGRWADMTFVTLVDIFKRLSFEDRYCNLSLVCKAWRSAVQDSACWEEVDMEPSFKTRRESDFWWNPEFERRMDAMIKNVVNWGSSQLRLLSTRHCSDYALTYVAFRCPNLQSLHIQMSQGVTDGSISLIALKCPKLKSVDLSECRGISAEALDALGKHCNELAVLKRNMLDIDGNCRLKSIIPLRYLQRVPIGDQEAICIADCMPHLKHLEMCYASIHDRGLAALVGSCTKLEILDLRGCSYLSGRALGDAERSLSSFTHFRKPIIERNSQLERYGHWQLHDNRFSLQYLEF